MNQVRVGFGADNTVYACFAQVANERLGNIDFIIQNTGASTLAIQMKESDGVTAPSGYANVGPAIVVVPGGQKTVSYTLLSQQVAFFGSGNTAVDLSGSATGAEANITAVLRNPSDLRGAQIDLVLSGRKGWGYDEAWNKNELKKKWGTVNPTTGTIDFSKEGI